MQSIRLEEASSLRSVPRSVGRTLPRQRARLLAAPANRLAVRTSAADGSRPTRQLFGGAASPFLGKLYNAVQYLGAVCNPAMHAHRELMRVHDSHPPSDAPRLWFIHSFTHSFICSTRMQAMQKARLQHTAATCNPCTCST